MIQEYIKPSNYKLPINKDQLTVVIPVKNEELAIGAVIEELREAGYNNILAIDGYSTDKTVKILDEKNVPVLTQHGKGKTGAIKTAIENVATPYLLILDGDYTYAAQDIQCLINHGGNYVQIIGVRDRKNIGLIHRFGNCVITKSFNVLMGTHFSDICSGMYLLRTDIARSLELGSRNFAAEVEIVAQTVLEYDVTEVPIKYRCRLGKPKLSWRNGFEILSSVISLARKYNPVFLFLALSALSIIPALGILSWEFFNEIVNGTWHEGWALLGVMLLLFASQAFAIATLSLLLKRVEKRIIQRVEKVKNSA
jgi:dolichol-phosphate mannosyltransferase